jgi:lysine 2,3-aminomutase
MVQRRKENRDRTIDYLGASLEDWNDYVWQMRNVMLTLDVIDDPIELTG